MTFRNFTSRAQKNALLAFLLASSAIFIVSCTSDYNLSVQDYDTAITLYSKSTDFSAYKYYIMPDTIVHIVPAGSKDDLNRKYDQIVLQNVAGNFSSRGYTRISDTTQHKPDFAIALVAYSSTYTAYYYDWWYYWGWYPYYPGGPGYGYYPPGGATYSYTTGSVVISMIDPAQSDIANKRIVPVWFGQITGLLGDTYSNSQTRIINGLNAVFTQSPYLASGK